MRPFSDMVRITKADELIRVGKLDEALSRHLHSIISGGSDQNADRVFHLGEGLIAVNEAISKSASTVEE